MLSRKRSRPVHLDALSGHRSLFQFARRGFLNAVRDNAHRESMRDVSIPQLRSLFSYTSPYTGEEDTAVAIIWRQLHKFLFLKPIYV